MVAPMRCPRLPLLEHSRLLLAVYSRWSLLAEAALVAAATLLALVAEEAG